MIYISLSYIDYYNWPSSFGMRCCLFYITAIYSNILIGMEVLGSILGRNYSNSLKFKLIYTTKETHLGWLNGRLGTWECAPPQGFRFDSS